MNFSDPRSTVLQMALRDGMRVGDFGTGTGHYSFAASPIVGMNGKVYAIDIQEDVLRHMHDTAARAGKTNINPIWGDIEKRGGTKLRDNALDAGILANTLFQLQDRPSAFAEIIRVLKPGGKLLIVDWAGSYDGIGPIPQHVVSEAEAEQAALTHGLFKEKSYRAGPHHYAILVTKSGV